MSRSARVGILTLGVLVGMALAKDGEPPPAPRGTHVYHFKERRPFTLDATRVAVLRAETPAAAPIQALRDSGAKVELAGIAEMAVPGWSILPTAPDGRTLERVAGSVQRLAEAPSVEFASPVFVGTDGGPVIITPRLLVRFHPDVPAAQAEAILDDVNAGAVLDRNWAHMPGAYRIRNGARDGYTVLETASALARRTEVLFAEPDMLFTGRGDSIPNDTFFSSLWGIHNTGQDGGTSDMDMDGPEAWNFHMGDSAVKVVIIDVGVQQTHPDINQLPGIDVTSQAPGAGGGPVNGCDNHGTPVAGCVSAVMNNSLGVVGIAPGCKSVSARTFISNIPCTGGWTSTASWTVDTLAFAESIGAKVTNNSNYYGFASAAIEAKYEQTRDGGMVHFASAGNDSSPFSTYPASLPTVNSVAALERHGNRAGFSNYGSDLFISAPGESVLSTDRTSFAGYVGGDYVFIDGTSFASPYTAGVAALVFSVNSALPAASVESILASTAVDLGVTGWDTDFGWGFVNAHRAVLSALDPCDDPAPPVCCESAADCQPNGIRDLCEIDIGLARDCNANSVPDECDIAQCLLGDPSCQDCNLNEIPDACDIASGSSPDRDSNDVPDECQPPPAALPDPAGESTRAISVIVQPLAPATGLVEQVALRVTMVDLQHPVPANAPERPPRDFSAWDTRVNGVCVGGSHDGHHCDVDADCRLCAGGPEGTLNRACTSDADCGGGAGSCPPGGACGSLAACTATGELGGCARWVGPPFAYLEKDDRPDFGNFRASRLQCSPFYYDWGSEPEGLATVIGPEIMPSSLYEVQVLASTCKGTEDTCTAVSDAVAIGTRRFGDVVTEFNPPALTKQPDGADVTAAVNKFKNLPGVISKLIAQIQPNAVDPNQNQGGSDIVDIINAFRGFKYSYAGPCPCPTGPCNAACTSASDCPAGTWGSGATCQKVCTSGPRTGQPCNADLDCGSCSGGDNGGAPCKAGATPDYCPGGSCFLGVCGPDTFCRDACGRCN